jgi:hypothetical protein
MSQGALLIARNNSEIDYIKQAVYLAKRIRKYVDLPTSIITDNKNYLINNYDYTVFDQIIEVANDSNYTFKRYNDGTFTRKRLEFKNTSRSCAFDLTPYDETLLLDTDFIVSTDLFKQCFLQKHDFLLYKNGFEFSGWRDLSEFDYISETGPEFYWATVVFFRKTETNKIFFNLLQHIQENWAHYKNLYQLTTGVFRNDHAFSIAIHTMNGYKSGNFAKEMPGTLFYTTDRDLVLEINDNEFLFLIEKETENNNYFPVKIKNSNVHIMNKFSLGRVIDNDN